ncbi:MAG: hypothetical protein EB117_16890 [Betaproteobacteria bacterium]|nr:hypothetical protein [Betaproteobacteria bacterium]
MTYCMFENTAGEMSACLNQLEDNLDNPDFLRDMNQYERDGIMRLCMLAKRFSRYESRLNRLQDELLAEDDQFVKRFESN